MKSHQPTILFYVSGHGFGHSTRTIEVARHLPKDTRIIFKTSAPRWLYECYCERPFEFQSIDLDVGVVQADSLSLDAERTLKAYADLLDRAPSLIESESRFVQDEEVDLIFGDIPPLAFEIAQRTGVPSIGMANFSWDWIYAPYVKHHPEYEWLIETICRAYHKCDLLLRLPFYGDLSVFPKIISNPLVVRKPQGDKNNLKQRLGIVPNRKVVLISFGGFDLERIPWDRVQKMDEYLFIYFHSTKSDTHNILYLPEGSIPHVDVVQLADVVLSKPGYGMCAECIQTQTPFVYTDRGEFLEYEYLVKGLKRYGRSLYIPQTEVLAGNWGPWLEDAQNLPDAEENMETDGARMSAEQMVELLLLRLKLAYPSYSPGTLLQEKERK